MSIIAKQPYIKVLREVTSLEQIDIRDERVLYLYADKIVTQHREFPIEEVLDISYRQMGPEGGLLYLHMNSSVFSYIVQTDADRFIEAVKQSINR